MLFNSLAFLLFFILIVPSYFLLPHRWRWILLLGASAFFYMSFIPAYILILMVTIIIDYSAGLLMDTYPDKKKKILVASIIANVGMLFVFKYFNFFIGNISFIGQLLGWNYSLHTLNIILPLGLSFHTFQSLSYTIEVYKGNQKAERHFGIFALYVLFFPQLVAGPIERPQNLLHQFHEKHSADWQRISRGLVRMLYGFFKKIFIADNLARFVDQIYNQPSDHLGPSMVIATIFFAFQIYCDFSGYSDIALGSAEVLGFTLMENFRAPYLSRSISEFWRRWHISLSSWFKEYVYIPLGGNRVSKPRQIFNLLLTFLLSGVWHGANWTFVVWGALNGLYLAVGMLTKPFRERLFVYKSTSLPYIFGQILVTFALTCFTWIFFRANSLAQAKDIILRLGQGWQGLPSQLQNKEFLAKNVFLGLSETAFYWCLFGIATLMIIEILQEYEFFSSEFFAEHKYVKALGTWFLISTAMLLILVFGQSQSQQFIYFQF